MTIPNVPGSGRKAPSRLLPLLLSFALAALSATCGSEREKANIDMNGHVVVWNGAADADPSLKADVDATVACLQENQLATRAGYPLVVVIDGNFNCNGILSRGCAEIGGETIYISREFLYTTVFTHEVIHWETGMGNEYHNTPQFECCSSVLES